MKVQAHMFKELKLIGDVFYWFSSWDHLAQNKICFFFSFTVTAQVTYGEQPPGQFLGPWIWVFVSLSTYPSQRALASPGLFHPLCECLRTAIYRRFFSTKSVCSACYGIFPRGGRTGNYLKSTGRLEECYGGTILQGSPLQKARVSFANKWQLLFLTPREAN